MCQADPRCRKLDLESFLIKPMQRICRYPLLLKVRSSLSWRLCEWLSNDGEWLTRVSQELLKRTPETHPDYESLKLALEKVQAVVATVNEKKRESENQEKVMMIQLAMVWQGDVRISSRLLLLDLTARTAVFLGNADAAAAEAGDRVPTGWSKEIQSRIDVVQ